ncbi:MAG: ribonuclease III [Pseudomonadota bacterium]
MASCDLNKLLDQDFLNSSLFQEAVTHRSVGSRNNERLEYLGDSVLDLIIAQYLFVKFPDLKEGDLSRTRSHLVKKDTLAEIGSEIDLGRLIALGQGELKSGGQKRSTIIADALEAIIGALYLHKGLSETQDFIFKLFKSRLNKLPSPEQLKDPKSQLQELLQAKNMPLARYSLINTQGASHAQSFNSLCTIKVLSIITSAWGSTKRRAEQASARKALDIILKFDEGNN